MTKKFAVFKTPIFRKKLKSIYLYSRKEWGVRKAQQYVSILNKTIDEVSEGIKQTKINPDFSTRFSYCIAGRHYIFFEFLEDKLIVANIYHTAQAVNTRLELETEKAITT